MVRRSLTLQPISPSHSGSSQRRSSTPTTLAPLAETPGAPKFCNWDYYQAVKHYKLCNLDRHGRIDCDGFSQFLRLQCPREVWSKAELNDLFLAVDVDHSGALDLEKIVAWIFCGGHPAGSNRQAPASPSGTLRQSNLLSPSPSRPLSPSPPQTPTTPHAPASPTSPGMKHSMSSSAKSFMRSQARPPKPQPVVLQFTHSIGFKDEMLWIKNWLTKCAALKGTVSVRSIVDLEATGCTRVFVPLGFGLVLWDRPSMMAYREDPFVTHQLIEAWVEGMAATHLPWLVRSLNA
mmetsp:Transcript_36404/g.102623  ORF Transcript_36404/g.102623 Transcript_36404/m.102623 type:complete len:291 (+) Transcript_36404:81-953(+)